MKRALVFVGAIMVCFSLPAVSVDMVGGQGMVSSIAVSQVDVVQGWNTLTIKTLLQANEPVPTFTLGELLTAPEEGEKVAVAAADGAKAVYTFSGTWKDADGQEAAVLLSPGVSVLYFCKSPRLVLFGGPYTVEASAVPPGALSGLGEGE